MIVLQIERFANELVNVRRFDHRVSVCRNITVSLIICDHQNDVRFGDGVKRSNGKTDQIEENLAMHRKSQRHLKPLEKDNACVLSFSDQTIPCSRHLNGATTGSVSYTHLTLPTTSRV